MVMRETLDGFQGGLQIGKQMTKVIASDGIACRILIQNEQSGQVDVPVPWVPDYRRKI